MTVKKGNLGYSPEVSIDCVVFGFHENELKILLLEFINSGFMALPGGFILENEDLDFAAKRILEERTSAKDIFLQQFEVFGDPNRTKTKNLEILLNGLDIKEEEKEYMRKRFISIGYYALIDYTGIKLNLDAFSSNIGWYDINNIPQLLHDHNLIIKRALETLQLDLNKKPIGQNLMPEQFTMKELQNLHEVILGKKLARTNFQRKILSLDILERIEKKYTGKAHKAPFLYRFKTKEE